MFNLEQLINKLCPNGVKFMQIKELGQVKMCKRILKSETNTLGGVPFYKIGTFGKKPDAYISEDIFNKYKQQYSYPKKGDILISCSGTIGRTVVFDGNPAYFQDSNIVWLEHDGTKVLNEYLKYVYSTKPWQISTGGTIARLYNDNILNAKIAVPPLEVQRKIIHILDNFTLLSEKLSTELSSEIKAREKQYNYYKDKFFLDLQHAPKYKLSEIAEIYDGTHQTPKYTDSGVSFISVENINDIYNSKKYISKEDFDKYKIKPKINDVFMTRIGTIGKCSVYDKEKDLAYYVSLALIRPNIEVVNSYYLKFLIESIIGIKELRKRTLVNAVPIKVNKDDIGKIELPIPSLEEQEKIVQILTKFDKITNDMIEGLPTEIEARQKQYEYYRDKLLTFKEFGNE